MPSLGFVVSNSDPSLFVKQHDGHVVILLLYVDDIIIIGTDSVLVQQVIDNLGEVFDMKDMGRLAFFLGLQITYKDNGDLFISQSKYVKDLLKKAAMKSCKHCPTPYKPHTSLFKDEGTPITDPTLFRSLVGPLQYLTFTGPDIAFAVNYACQFMSNPNNAHFHLVKRIFRYLQGTLECGLTYSSTNSLEILAYSDANWASDVNTKR
ncbi:uncharacterized mitochondrial protein AtMg00810-like [Malus domestica]|uniref:uncharacterized mitochondrial protein AtMg00810-like n=1 Tax=Malus domestica TaxID=3750 RepID=UPI0010AA3E0E|nr:uncharacterized protein LOC114825129 [Malus domestica]